jgi:cytochrome c6
MIRRFRSIAPLALLAITAALASAAAAPDDDGGSVAPLPAPAQTMSTPAESTAEAANGKTLFSQNCARCHGFNMANPAPGVFDLRTFPTEDKPRFVAAVSEGKGAMPAWKAVLSPAEIESLWAYVSSSHSP